MHRINRALETATFQFPQAAALSSPTVHTFDGALPTPRRARTHESTKRQNRPTVNDSCYATKHETRRYQDSEMENENRKNKLRFPQRRY
jgi:hypothetical protein